jgi:hypothetical protein
MSLTVLDGLNELAREQKQPPCRDGLRVKTGATGCAEGRRTVKDLRVICAVRGMSCLRPLNPPTAGHPSLARNIPRLWREGRASKGGLSSKYSESRHRSLDPPRPIQATNFGFQPRRVPRCRWRGIRPKKF